MTTRFSIKALHASRPGSARAERSEGADDARFHQLGEMIETMSCGLVVRDNDGDIHYVNERLNRWLGYEPGELDGQSIAAILPKEQQALFFQDLAELEDGDLRARLVTLRRKDSTTFPALVLPQLLLDDDAKVVGGFGAIVDLGTVQTAKPLGAAEDDPRAVLSRVASELQTLSLRASFPIATPATLEHSELTDLSTREREVLTHLVQGDRVPAIARRLFISPNTVRNHLKSIYRKLGVGSQSELIERIRALGRGTESPASAD